MEIGSTFFGCWSVTGQLKKENMIFYHQYEISIDKIPSCPILLFWDLGRIMAVGQNRLKIVILEFFYHHYEISER
jgi:hypothetical protein